MTGSLAASFASSPRTEWQAALAALTRDELLALEYDWRFWARPAQLPPPGEWTAWLVMAGRGYGKTRTGAEFVRQEIEAGRSGRAALVGPTAADARDVMVEGESGIIAISPPWMRPTYEPSKRRLTWPNGAVGTLYSADEPDRLRGPQHDLAWCDEIATWRYPEAYDQLMFGLRLGLRPRVIATTTPKPTELVRRLVADPTCIVTTGRTVENAPNLAPVFLSHVVARYQGTRLGRQELDAELLEDIPGALWTLGLIEQTRLPLRALRDVALARVVVAIDPNVTSGADADEAGIVAVARGAGPCPCGGKDCAYVLEDASGDFGPAEWARKAIALYHRRRADRIVAEANNGGELVELQLRVLDPNVSYTAVHAARGKFTRAEPVEALYEQSRVHHAGHFPEMEDQMTRFVPNDGQPSPGRLDALVWAVTELMLDDDGGLLDFYGAQLEARAASPSPTTEPSHAWPHA